MPSYDKRLLERRQFSHLTLAYFPKCQFLKVQCVKFKRLYLYNKATKSYTLELDDRLLLESVNCMIFSVWFGVLNIQPARLTRFLYQLPKASWWILQQINIKDFNFPFPPVLRLIRESCRTSRLCAPASPDSSSRTCVPFLLLWWRTEPWSLLILWVSKHTASSHPFGFFFFPLFRTSNQVLDHECQVQRLYQLYRRHHASMLFWAIELSGSGLYFAARSWMINRHSVLSHIFI